MRRSFEYLSAQKRIRRSILEALEYFAENEWVRQDELWQGLCESERVRSAQKEVFELVLSELVSQGEVLEREVWGETAETEVKLPSSEDGKLRLVA